MRELTYIGAFKLPRGPRTSEGIPDNMQSKARFGFGGRAMCLRGTDELVISGHEQADLVGSVKIPQPFISAADEVRNFPDAALSAPFFQVTPLAALHAKGLNTLVGLEYEDGRLYSLWQEFYDVDGVDGDRASLWDGDKWLQVGNGKIKETSGYLAARNNELWFGRSHGAGNASVPHGPILFKGVRGERIFHDQRQDWTAADDYTALGFFPGHVCWLVSKALGPVWYGGRFGPNGEKDPWKRTKGYHTTERAVWLLPYTWPGLERRSPISLPQFEPNSACGGMAYDPQRRRVYVHELWPPATIGSVYTGEQPRIHMYDLAADEPDEPDEPERDTITITVTRPDGTVYAGDIEREDE